MIFQFIYSIIPIKYLNNKTAIRIANKRKSKHRWSFFGNMSDPKEILQNLISKKKIYKLPAPKVDNNKRQTVGITAPFSKIIKNLFSI